MNHRRFILAALCAIGVGAVVGQFEPHAQATSCYCMGDELTLEPTDVPGEVCTTGNNACTTGFYREGSLVHMDFGISLSVDPQVAIDLERP